MKLTVVTPIPTPYRDPFWNAVARQPGVDMTVLYCADGKSDRPWITDWTHEYAAEVLPGRNLLAFRGSDASCFHNPGVTNRLRQIAPDALIVGGYNHPTMWAAMREALHRGIPYFLMCETYRQQSRGWKGTIKRRMAEHVIRHAAGLLPTGTRAEGFLRDRGAPPERITRLPNVPDVCSLARKAVELRPQRGRLRRDHGLDNQPTALFVGRLIPKKRAALLLRAFARAFPDGEAQLAIVGDGLERPALEAQVRTLGIAPHVRFAGFVQPDQIPAWHAMADLFVMPSTETWGVSPIEALASGLSVILSDGVGCHPDVVTSPSVGRVIPADDEQALSDALAALLASPPAANTVAEAWRPVRDALAYDHLADRLVTAVRVTPSTASVTAPVGMTCP